jgi:hypothetical protein
VEARAVRSRKARAQLKDLPQVSAVEGHAIAAAAACLAYGGVDVFPEYDDRTRAFAAAGAIRIVQALAVLGWKLERPSDPGWAGVRDVTPGLGPEVDLIGDAVVKRKPLRVSR